MRTILSLQLLTLILTFIFSPSPLPPRPSAPLLLHSPLFTLHAPLLPPAPPLSCSPYAAPLLTTYHHPRHTTSRFTLTAVFNPDDILFDRSFYTVNGRSWHTDIIPGDATCPAQIQLFLDYTLGTLNTGSPPFRYTQGHDLTAYTNFLHRVRHLCNEQAMAQTICRLRHLYLPVARVGE